MIINAGIDTKQSGWENSKYHNKQKRIKQLETQLKIKKLEEQLAKIDNSQTSVGPKGNHNLWIILCWINFAVLFVLSALTNNRVPYINSIGVIGGIISWITGIVIFSIAVHKHKGPNRTAGLKCALAFLGIQVFGIVFLALWVGMVLLCMGLAFGRGQ